MTSKPAMLELLIVKLEWLLSQTQNYTSTTDWQTFQPYTAKEMTRQQCAIFDRYVFS